MTSQPAPTQPLPQGPGSDVESVVRRAFGEQPGLPTAEAGIAAGGCWEGPTPDQLQPPPGLPPGFVMPNYGLPLQGQDPNTYTIPSGPNGLGCGLLPPSEEQTASALMQAAAKDPRLAKLLQSFVTDHQERQADELRRYKKLASSFLRQLADVVDGDDEEGPAEATKPYPSTIQDYLNMQQESLQAAGVMTVDQLTRPTLGPKEPF